MDAERWWEKCKERRDSYSIDYKQFISLATTINNTLTFTHSYFIIHS